MERQVYPRRLNPDGTAEPPYDVAGWTLPLQMGVRVATVAEPLSVTADRVETIDPIRGEINGEVDEAKVFSIANRANDDFLVLNALLEAGVGVDLVRPAWQRTKIRVAGGLAFPAPETRDFGALVFPADEKARRVLQKVLPTVSTQVTALSQPPGASARLRLSPSRIGLYQPWMPSMDEGWTRLVLEKYGFKYTTLHIADVCAGSLKERVDVLLIPSIEPKTLRRGLRRERDRACLCGRTGQRRCRRPPRVPQGGGDARLPGATRPITPSRS